jgi:hypothetical protein
MTHTLRAWIGLSALLQLAACAGSGDGLDASGRPVAPGDGGGSALTPDLASIQANVFTPICAQCHVGASAPQGLRLDAASSYGSLVGVASSESPGTLRVKPADPGSSYLIQKIEGRAAVGARMPLGQPALPDATIQVIRQWITNGAPRGATGSAATLAVQSVAVAPGEIAVSMTRPVDASLVNGTTVSLERHDEPTGDTTAVAIRTLVSPYDAALILVKPAQLLAPGRYRLTLRGTGPAALADWNAMLLDGDGDGAPGGDAVRSLTAGGGQ